MPFPQLEPIAFAPASARPRAARGTSTPMMVKKPLGVGSKVMVARMGIVAETERAASTARVASARSVMVSMHSRSTPAAIRAAACRRKPADTSSGSASP